MIYDRTYPELDRTDLEGTAEALISELAEHADLSGVQTNVVETDDKNMVIDSVMPSGDELRFEYHQYSADELYDFLAAKNLITVSTPAENSILSIPKPLEEMIKDFLEYHIVEGKKYYTGSVDSGYVIVSPFEPETGDEVWDCWLLESSTSKLIDIATDSVNSSQDLFNVIIGDSEFLSMGGFAIDSGSAVVKFGTQMWMLNMEKINATPEQLAEIEKMQELLFSIAIARVMLADVTLALTYNEETGKYEANSCTIAHGLFFTNDGADLTIVDTAGTAAVNVYGMASAAYSSAPDSIITIEGGTWNNMGCETCGSTNIFLYTSHGGELYIEGGYFAQDLDADGNSYLIVEHGGAYANSVIDFAKSKIEITGGTFAGMNPELAHYFEQTADNKLVIGATTNVVAEGYYAKDNGDDSWTVLPKPVAKVEVEIMPGVWASSEITKANWADLVTALGENTNLPVKVTLYEDIELAETLVISGDKTVELNLNGKTVTTAQKAEDIYMDAFTILTNVTVNGNGTIDARPSNGYTFYVGSHDGQSGSLTIENGSFYGETSVVQVTKGELNIADGYFQVDPYEGSYQYTLNCIDANYADGSAVISVTGGTYYGFDPEDCEAEGAGTNFCAVHYVSVDNGDNTWTVKSAAEAGYVAYNVQDQVYFTDLSDALNAANSGETVQLVADTTESIVIVSANVAFDLNGHVVESGNVLSFGAVIDTAAEAGGIKIDIDVANAFTKLQPENAGYLPIYDTTDGTYKFYAYELVNKGAKAAGSAAKFGIAIIFENAEAYNVLANTGNSGMTLSAKLTWTDMSVPYVDYKIPESAIKLFAENAYTQLTTKDVTETTYAITLTVSGLTSLDSGDFVAAAPSINTVAEVGSSNEAIVYTLP